MSEFPVMDKVFVSVTEGDELDDKFIVGLSERDICILLDAAVVFVFECVMLMVKDPLSGAKDKVDVVVLVIESLNPDCDNC